MTFTKRSRVIAALLNSTFRPRCFCPPKNSRAEERRRKNSTCTTHDFPIRETPPPPPPPPPLLHPRPKGQRQFSLFLSFTHILASSPSLSLSREREKETNGTPHFFFSFFLLSPFLPFSQPFLLRPPPCSTRLAC